MRYELEDFSKLTNTIKACSHLPAHSSREIVIIFGSLTTVDPGNIHDTLDACIKDKIRISVVALAAEMKICRNLCDRTGGEFIAMTVIKMYRIEIRE